MEKIIKEDLKEIFSEIQNEVETKWFFVFKIKKEIKKNDILIFFKNFFLPFFTIFSWMILIIILLSSNFFIIFENKNKFIYIILFLFLTISIILTLFYRIIKMLISIKNKNYFPIKNKIFKTDLMVLENLTFINWKIFERNYKTLNESKNILLELQKSSKLKFLSINKENKFFFDLRKNFLKLDFLYQILDILISHIIDEIEERKSGEWKDKDLENAFLKFDEKVKQIYEIKDKILKIVWEKNLIILIFQNLKIG